MAISTEKAAWHRPDSYVTARSSKTLRLAVAPAWSQQGHKHKRTQSDTIGHNKNMWERNGTNELGIPLLTLELLPGCNFRQHAPVPMAIRSAVKEETRDMGSSENRVPDFSLVV